MTSCPDHKFPTCWIRHVPVSHGEKCQAAEAILTRTLKVSGNMESTRENSGGTLGQARMGGRGIVAVAVSAEHIDMNDTNLTLNDD